MTEEPLYNIGVVTRLTGITTSTLHAWERRYGFPKATRTSSGHRLFSEKDIARLRWVKAQIDGGMTVSRAIRALPSFEEKGSLFTPTLPRLLPSPAEGAPVSARQDALYDFLVRHDLPAADRLLGKMLAFHSPEDLTLEVIAPTLARIGDAWEQGQISVGTEHMASNYLRHRLLMWMVTGPSPRASSNIVLACAPGEWHEGSLLMLGVLLRRRGWPVAYLGQNVPLETYPDLLQQFQPAAIVLVAMQAETARGLAGWTRWIPQVGGKPPVLFGGRAFALDPGLQQVVPGYYLGNTIGEGVKKLESLLG